MDGSTPASERDGLDGARAKRVRLCDAEALRPGEMLGVRPPGFEAIALYLVEGVLYATQDTCSHAKASLTQGWLDGDRVSCPAHAAEFCIRTGTALCFPAEQALRTFPIWREGAALFADLSTAVRTGS